MSLFRFAVRFAASRIRVAIPPSLRVAAIAKLVPRRRWFGAAVIVSRLQGSVAAMGSPMSVEWASAMALEWWLIKLSERGEFPVRYQVEGLDVVASALRDGGTLVCGAHVPHLRLAIRSLIDRDLSVGFMVTTTEHISPQGRWLPTGWPQGVTPVAQGPETLLKVRARLQQGELGAMLLDRDAGGPFYPNGMRLAGRLGMRVVLSWTEYEEDGTFRITFREAPYSVPDTDEKVSANLAVLDAQRKRILAPLLHPVHEQREVSLRRGFVAGRRS